MEKYNHHGGYEAQGSIEISRNGCGQRTHRFVMVGCEAADDCMQTYRVIFRTETCNGQYLELTGVVHAVQAVEPAPPCAQERRIVDKAGCGAENTGTIWTACNEQTCGCRAQQESAFTYDSIRKEQKNGSLWDNWMRRGQNGQ